VHHLFENNFGGTEARSLLIAAIFSRKLMGVVPECWTCNSIHLVHRFRQKLI